MSSKDRIKKYLKRGLIVLLISSALICSGVIYNNKGIMHADSLSSFSRMSETAIKKIRNNLSITQHLGKKNSHKAVWVNKNQFPKSQIEENYGDQPHKGIHKYRGKYVGDYNATFNDGGNLNVGSPHHYRYDTPGILRNGHDYDGFIGHFHSHLEYKDLIKHSGAKTDFRVIYPKGMKAQECKPMILKFPDAARYYDDNGHKHNLTVELQITPEDEYVSWNSYRSISVSGDIYDGIFQNGFKRLKLQYQFIDNKTKKPINLNNSWLRFRQINGLEPYASHHKIGDTKQDGEDAWRNDGTWVYHNLHDRYHGELGGISYIPSHTNDHTSEYIDGINGEREYAYSGKAGKSDGKYGIKEFRSFTIGQTVIGGAYDTPYDDEDNGIHNHDILLHLNGTTATFEAGTSVGYDSIQPVTNGFRKPSPPSNHYICVSGKNNQPEIYKSVMQKNHKSKITKANLTNNTHVTANMLSYNGKINGKRLNFSTDKSMFKKLTTKHIKNKNTYYTLRSSKLFNGFNPKTGKDEKVDAITYWKENIAKCIPKSKKTIKYICKATNNGKDEKFYRVTYINGEEKSKNAISRSEAIKHIKDCKVKKQTPPTPPKNPKLHKSLLKGKSDKYGFIHHKTIKSDDGGVLREPDQTYTYIITGHTPKYHNNENDGSKGCGASGPSDRKQENTAKWESTQCGSTKHPKTDWYTVPTNNGDYYKMSDSLPKYVSLKSYHVSGINTSGVIIKAPRNGQSFSMKLHRNSGYGGSILNDQNRNYKIYLTVTANHLPKVTSGNYGSGSSHWLRYWNGNHYQNGTYDQYKINSSNVKKRYSNPVPVEIKKMKAIVYHYDYNWNNKIKHNWYPNKAQPLGTTTCNGKANRDRNYGGIDFKNYRYKNSQFNKNHILGKDVKYGYVNTDFNEHSVNSRKNNNSNWIFRSLYPALSKHRGDEIPRTSLEKSNVAYQKLFILTEKHLSKHSFQTILRDRYDYTHKDGYLHFIMNMNPDGCGNNAYNSNGFTQTNYIPYIVPQMNINPPYTPGTPSTPGNPPSKKQWNEDNSRMVIDTDKASHGLPFHFDTRIMNALYGDNPDNDSAGTIYHKDFNNDKVVMNVTTKNGTPLYKAVRPLTESKYNHRDLANFSASEYHKKHHISKDEYPIGLHNWRGYADDKALLKSRYTKAYDLNTSALKNYAKNHKSIPVEVSFNQGANNKYNPNHDRIIAPTIYTRAYFAQTPKITRKSTKSTGNYHDDSMGNKDQKTDIMPERTIKYGAGTDSPKVRVLNELFSIQVPYKLVGKTGFGMTANDIIMTYRGHLNALNYARKGTNTLTAYPKAFNNDKSDIHESNDPRASYHGNHITSNSKVENEFGKKDLGFNAEPMFHITPFFTTNNVNANGSLMPSKSHKYGIVPSNKEQNGLGENGKFSSKLDSANDNSNEVSSDNYWTNKKSRGHDFPEYLNAGSFSTTYGYIPKSSIHNNNGNKGNEQNGHITVSGEPQHGFGASIYYHDSKVNDKNGSSINFDHLTRNFYDMPTYKGSVESINNNIPHNADYEVLNKYGQSERLFTPTFLPVGTYNMYLERPFLNFSNGAYKHRLGGNFIDMNLDMPVTLFANPYLSKDRQESEAQKAGFGNTRNNSGNFIENNDELSAQPILSGKPMFMGMNKSNLSKYNKSALAKLAGVSRHTSDGNLVKALKHVQSQIPQSNPLFNNNLWNEFADLKL